MIDWTAVVVALLGFVMFLLQQRWYHRIRHDDRREAMEDARAEAQRGNEARWIGEVETYVKLVNGVIANMRLELTLPKARRQIPGQEQLQPVHFSIGVASAAAGLLDPGGTLVRAMNNLWATMRDLQTFSDERDDPVSTDDIDRFLEGPANSTYDIMAMLGKHREESA